MQGRGQRRMEGSILDQVAFLSPKTEESKGQVMRLSKGSVTPEQSFFPNKTPRFSAIKMVKATLCRFGKFSKAYGVREVTCRTFAEHAVTFGHAHTCHVCKHTASLEGHARDREQ